MKAVTWEGGETGPLPDDTISMYDFVLDGECELKQQLAASNFEAVGASGGSAVHEEL